MPCCASPPSLPPVLPLPVDRVHRARHRRPDVLPGHVRDRAKVRVVRPGGFYATHTRTRARAHARASAPCHAWRPRHSALRGPCRADARNAPHGCSHAPTTAARPHTHTRVCFSYSFYNVCMLMAAVWPAAFISRTHTRTHTHTLNRSSPRRSLARSLAPHRCTRLATSPPTSRSLRSRSRSRTRSRSGTNARLHARMPEGGRTRAHHAAQTRTPRTHPSPTLPLTLPRTTHRHRCHCPLPADAATHRHRHRCHRVRRSSLRSTSC
jgi:hypothetical protein